jgi:hypothetical protein
MMKREDFERDLRRARIYRETAAGMEQDYWLGYERGLRRAFYGAQFGTADENRVWLSLAGSEDLSRDARGRGYRDGLAKNPAAMLGALGGTAGRGESQRRGDSAHYSALAAKRRHPGRRRSK